MAGPPAQSNVRRKSPTGFSSGGKGGSTGNGKTTFVYAGAPWPCIGQLDGTSIVPQALSSKARSPTSAGADPAVGESTTRQVPFSDSRGASVVNRALGARA